MKGFKKIQLQFISNLSSDASNLLTNLAYTFFIQPI